MSKEVLEFEVLPAVRQFMAAQGLERSEEKTRITNIADGFDFLGQNVRKYDGYWPSACEDTWGCQNNRGSEDGWHLEPGRAFFGAPGMARSAVTGAVRPAVVASRMTWG
ncbi:hypothetical protein SAMN05445850_7067 [Paraburkholderia tuberum]|uniref:Uncharacterized protein n=1 Tax=Paraburkholderia tuberum TaxID=157910 RepID=A0A1H1KDF3_9BURK|nr:hypothetical protein SAMN05445850_7067 [Paraburkholderia tuberum]